MSKVVNQSDAPEAFEPFIGDSENLHEFTWRSVFLGVLLGILFGASSVYLLLKVGMTVSASVPIAVLSITFFRALSSTFGIRKATILENNIVQTTGSAGESIAFGVGVTMPALFLLGYEMDWVRVMTVSVLGGLLGVLMMIPLRRAFIVNQHGKLAYPEGTACAEVLLAGEKGGSSAKMVFVGFGIAMIHKFMSSACRLWSAEPSQNLYAVNANGTAVGLKGAAISGELSPELLGVGYIIGPRVASLMMAGAVLSYLVLGPLIAIIGDQLTVAVPPAVMQSTEIANDKGLIHNMEPNDIKANYLRYIGAGAVAAGGIISMCRALPLILTSVISGMRDMRGNRTGQETTKRRTQLDLPISVVVLGSVGLVLLLMLVPSLGLGFSLQGLAGALMILVFGFLFVTVSSRLTGEVGSSSNPTSGMTIATLLLTCLIFLVLGQTGPGAMLTALTVAAVVCIASANGGTISQDLKTGFLVGATPRKQQISILIGAGVSAMVIGLTLLALNSAGVHYTTKALPTAPLVVSDNATSERPGRPYTSDSNTYRIVHVRTDDANNPNVTAGRYLVDANGLAKYRTDLPINRQLDVMDNNEPAPKAFDAPQPQLFTSIIEGILGGKLQWGLVIVGVLIAVSLEFAGISALPFAVGMYIPMGATTPIFVGGLLKWLCDQVRGTKGESSESDTSPGVLLSSGYIAGGTLCGLMLALSTFVFDLHVYLPETIVSMLSSLNVSRWLPASYLEESATAPKVIAILTFVAMGIVLLFVSRREKKNAEAT